MKACHGYRLSREWWTGKKISFPQRIERIVHAGRRVLEPGRGSSRGGSAEWRWAPSVPPTFTLETDADTFLRVMVSSDTWATAFDEDRGARER
jgi:hypothetical protein